MFVAHEDQLKLLADLLTQARRGEGPVAVVGGPVGSGKSTLLRALAERAAEPADDGPSSLVMTGSGDPEERSVPFGVLRRLLHDSADGGLGDDGELRRLLQEPMPAGAPPERLLHEAALAFTSLVTGCGRPLVVVLDDARFVDGPSWHCLTAVLRRVRRPRTLLVVADSGEGASPDALGRSLQALESQCHTVDLPLLSVETIVERIGLPLATAAEAVAATGGHPLLLEALSTELGQEREGVAATEAAQDDVSRAMTGDSYRRALTGLLRRCGETTAGVLRALATLEPDTRTAAVAELAGLDEATCAWHLRLAESAGLLREGGFRHPAVPGLLLSEAAPEERRRLHLRAAQVLYADGAPPRAVARHLVEAGGTDAPWALPLLHEAAERATAEGEPREAVEYVRLVGRSSADERQLAAASALQVRAEWQSDPVQALRRLPEVVSASREGRLSARDTLSLVSPLLWFGRVEDAFDAIQRVAAQQDRLTHTERSLLYASRLWLSALYPAAVRELGQQEVTSGPAGSDSQVEAALLMALVLCPESAAGGEVAAERALRRGTLDERTVMLCVSALVALIHQGRLDLARTSCDRLVAEAARRGIPMWHGLLAGLRAEIALYDGELDDAVRFARTALEVVPAEAWGIRIAVPMGILVQALVARGEYEEVDALIGGEVPDALFQSPIAFYHLQARGRYLLAVGAYRAALKEFQLMGELATQWGVAPPRHMAWRLDMARAHLAAGQPMRARELVYAELGRTASDDGRERGPALRLLAAAAEGEGRLELYEQACEALRASGPRLELAHALAGLADAQRVAGNAAAAELTLAESHRLARACGVREIERVLSAGRTPVGPEAEESAEPAAELSEAEHRVAALAAAGFSNRRIASRLFVTVSTVEQHLTRIYRKLGVTRRAELAVVYPLADAGIG
ncbi:AAA family ATPase [Streptomyces sp. NPDC087903]|uniref:AAA family ATPase n=1 Tax=Streptomyces sp. NPDC087903 TaxID=3365819 RepID=UPI0037F65E71